MTLRLIAFEYLPRGPAGWTSGSLVFGSAFTIVGGMNGCGKTPIMKGVMTALGHETELPPEIIAQCESVRLTVDADGRRYEIVRALDDSFSALATDEDGGAQQFRSALEFSRWLWSLLGVPPRTLTTKRRTEAELYVNVVLPMIWVDQDHGWTSAYWVPPNRDFLLDQRQEVLRFVLGLPERHPFRERDEFEAAKSDLERVEHALELQRFLIERLRRDATSDVAEFSPLRARREELRTQLRESEGALEALRAVASHYDREILALEEQKAGVARQARVLAGRHGQLELTLTQIDGEVQVLTANVQATELLRQFCEHTQCRLFSSAEESYGRALLFMKDQIKDLKAAGSTLSTERLELDLKMGDAEAQLAAKRAEREKAVADTPTGQVLGKVESLTKALVEVELTLARLEQLAAEKEKFERLLEKKEQLNIRVQELRPRAGRRDGTAIADARHALGRRMEEWLSVLRTQNIHGSVSFSDDFVPIVGGEPFTATSHQSGSTRTRIVLAFHAAVLEVALERGGNHPGWLLLDAPKQHELHQDDLNAYLGRLRDVARRFPGRTQVVFSVADLQMPTAQDTVTWQPGFATADGQRYLGPTASKAEMRIPPLEAAIAKAKGEKP